MSAFARFAAVGALAFAVTAGVLVVAVRLGLSPYAAQLPAFTTGVLLTWALNRRLTFATPGPPTVREFAAYLAASALGLAANIAAFTAATAAGLPSFPALALATAAGMGVNWLGYSRVVFARR